jgi:hypothetical protein
MWVNQLRWADRPCTAISLLALLPGAPTIKAQAVNPRIQVQVARNVLRQELLEANCTVAALYDLLTDCRAKQLEQASWRAKDNLPMDFF